MSTYKNLIGKDVNFLTTDPDNAQAEGQIWYNSTSNVFKDLIVSEAWSSGANLLTARAQVGSAGTQTAGLCFGGYPGGTATGLTEEYGGSGWGAGGTMTTARREVAGLGIQTAALAVGGFISPSAPLQRDETELYNGTSWSEQNDLTTEKRTSGAAGTTSAGLVFGGLVPPNTSTDQTEEWDGTNWSEQNNLNTTRSHLSGAGTQTAALGFGGYIGGSGGTGATEEYDGSSWTTVNSMNTGRRTMGPAGTQTAALGFGGSLVPSSPTTSNATEQYDGTTWTTSPATLALGRRDLGGCGTQPAALAFGGNGPSPNTASTEEYNRSINVTTGAAWASGGNMNTGRGTAGDCGTYLAGLVFGGNPGNAPYQVSLTEEYNGTSWSESGDLAHDSSDASGAGTQTAAVAFGLSASPNTITQHYDGSTWTTVPGSLPTSQQGARGIGTQTAALSCGFGTPTFEYDGSSWTAGGALNNNRTAQKPGGWGLQTAAVLAGGYSSPPATIISNTETYNGTSWTETGHSLLTALKRTAATTAGTNTSGMIFSGPSDAGSNDSTVITQGYNGTSWFTQPSLATARTNAQGFGTSTNAVAAGGDTYPGGPVGRNLTEEFTGETTALNIKTITTS